MRTKIIIWAIVISLGLMLTSCVVTNPKFFAKTLQTDDPSYGYTPENPITIKNRNLKNSIHSSYYYLSRLRTQKGANLKLLERFSVDNPNYKKPEIPLTNRYTGQPLSYGTGPLLDYYILITDDKTDTVKLYINPYLKGEIKIPVGLKFENE